MWSVLFWPLTHLMAGTLPTNPSPVKAVPVLFPAWTCHWDTQHPQCVALLADLSLWSTRYWSIATAFQLAPAPCLVSPTTHYCTVAKVIFIKHRNHPITLLIFSVVPHFLQSEIQICCLAQVSPKDLTLSFKGIGHLLVLLFHNKCGQNSVSLDPQLCLSVCTFSSHNCTWVCFSPLLVQPPWVVSGTACCPLPSSRIPDILKMWQHNFYSACSVYAMKGGWSVLRQEELV